MNGNIEEQLREQGYYVSTTVGYSMYPMLRDRRDRIVLRAVKEGEQLSRFDLPLYRRPNGNYVLHRIIGYEEGGYRIRGDNTYAVEHIPKAWILGVVTEFHRNGKKWSTDSRRYRFYARAWNAIYPLRSLWRRTKIGLKRFLKKQKKKDEQQ